MRVPLLGCRGDGVAITTQEEVVRVVAILHFVHSGSRDSHTVAFQYVHSLNRTMPPQCRFESTHPRNDLRRKE